MFELTETDKRFINEYYKDDPVKQQEYIAEVKRVYEKQNEGKPDRPDIQGQKLIPCGSFTTSGKLFVSDPCYDLDTWCTHTIEHASPGVWDASYLLSNEGSFHGHPDLRIREVIVEHHDSLPVSKTLEWKEVEKAHIGVDSGQAGFFDLAKRSLLPEVGEYGDLNTFYGKVCKLTHIEGKYNRKHGWHESWPSAGIIEDWGVASSSGWGDGGYSLYTKTLLGFVVAAKIVFISDYEDEDEYKEEFEEENED